MGMAMKGPHQTPEGVRLRLLPQGALVDGLPKAAADIVSTSNVWPKGIQQGIHNCERIFSPKMESVTTVNTYHSYHAWDDLQLSTSHHIC
jgi:hypothetical protein